MEIGPIAINTAPRMAVRRVVMIGVGAGRGGDIRSDIPIIAG